MFKVPQDKPMFQFGTPQTAKTSKAFDLLRKDAQESSSKPAFQIPKTDQEKIFPEKSVAMASKSIFSFTPAPKDAQVKQAFDIIITAKRDETPAPSLTATPSKPPSEPVVKKPVFTFATPAQPKELPPSPATKKSPASEAIFKVPALPSPTRKSPHVVDLKTFEAIKSSPELQKQKSFDAPGSPKLMSIDEIKKHVKTIPASELPLFEFTVSSAEMSVLKKTLQGEMKKSDLASLPAFSFAGDIKVTPTQVAEAPKDIWAAAKKVATGWSCSVCMIQNKEELTKCAACETDKPGSAPSKTLSAPVPSSVTFGSATPKPAETPASTGVSLWASAAKSVGWDCSVCLVPNKADADKCIACETDKPGAVKKTPAVTFGAPSNTGTPAVTFGSTKSTFTFGTAPKTEEKPAISFGTPVASKLELNSSVTPGLDLWKKPMASGDSWDCSTCMIKNKSADLKCVACETDKPGAKASDSKPAEGKEVAKPQFSFGSSASSFQFPGSTNPANSDKPGFSFGAFSTPARVEAQGANLGFSFGAAKTPGAFTFGGSSDSTSSTGFTFGSSNKQ